MRFPLSVLSIMTLLMITTSLTSQITLGTETLPDFGDVLVYEVFEDFEDQSFQMTGQDMQWTFGGFVVLYVSGRLGGSGGLGALVALVELTLEVLGAAKAKSCWPVYGR